MRPKLLFADDNGTIYDHPELEMVGCRGTAMARPEPRNLTALPEMSRLYFHPGCPPYGYDPRRKRIVLLEQTRIGNRQVRCSAVSAFIQQGWVRLMLPAMDYRKKSYTLPMWAYSAVGIAGDSYYVPAFEIDDNFRWKPENFDDRALLPHLKKRLREFPGNRLVRHLDRCARNYHCFAAKNFFFRRWEAPIPTSPACNSGCLGCISLQPEGGCCAPQARISFVPGLDDITEPFVRHLEKAQDAIISFGQGCEGEPLLQGPHISRAIAAIRRRTGSGTINLNTNGSLPELVRRICASGLDSIRISMNSARRDLYNTYYRPRGYCFEDVITSMTAAREAGVFTMINYLIFPGVTDQPSELEALKCVVEKARPDLIHFKNLNIDPDYYMRSLPLPPEAGTGINNVMECLDAEFPDLQFGYYNRTREHFFA